MPDERQLLTEWISELTPDQITPFAAVHHRYQRRIRRRRVGGSLVAGVALVGVVSGINQIAHHGDTQPSNHPTAAQSPPTTVPHSPTTPPAGAAMSCAEGYGVDTLGHRSFAFDGTVVAVSPQSQPPEATFRVHQWFTGGHGPSTTVHMPGRPDAGGDATSEFGVPYHLGSRLLVSGEPRWGGPPLKDAIAWACGFTRPYSAADANLWELAFHPGG